MENNDYLYDAVVRLEKLSNLNIEIESSRKEYDAIMDINNIQFVVKAKTEIRSSNKSTLISQIEITQQSCNRPVIIIAKYVALDIRSELKKRKINYLDVAGNCFINYKELLIFISGQKTQKISKTNQSRAFQEAGVKLIFNLLSSPGNLQYSYRKLAEQTSISIGSVSNIINELTDLNFLIIANKKRVLKNIPQLLDRWTIAYTDVLRPRLVKKRMRFSKKNNNWDKIGIQNIKDVNLWGGEPAAAILNEQLQPEVFTIYTNGNWQNIVSELKLIPDDDGEIEILSIFWNEEESLREKYITPTLLIYADLIASGYERNAKIAKQLLENELKFIK